MIANEYGVTFLFCGNFACLLVCTVFKMSRSSAMLVHVCSEVSGLLESLQKILPCVNFKQISSTEKCTKSVEFDSEDLKLFDEAEILIADSKIIGNVLYDIPKAKWVQSTWAGVETLFRKSEPNKPHPHFLLTKLGNDTFADYMAEYAIAQIIINERRFFQIWDNQKLKKWVHPAVEGGRLISELVIGIMGIGAIGSRIAQYIKQSGASVYGFAKHPRKVEEYGYFDRIETDISPLLLNCDYLCNVLPSTSETIGLLNRNNLKTCVNKPVFINLGRGDIIAEDDLVLALQEGWISKAVLDVFHTEPLPPESQLWKLPNVVITPHIGSITQAYQVAQCFSENYKRYVAGDKLLHIVDWKSGY